MTEMNFIPASVAQLQRNQRLLLRGGIGIVGCGIIMLAIYSGLMVYNKYLEREINNLSTVKSELSQLLQSRDSENATLKESKLIAASLDQLNSFSAVADMLEILRSIPDETSLSSFQTEFSQSGESIITLDGTASSHQDLNDWISTLQLYQSVQSVELISINSIQSTSDDLLKQRFLLEITSTVLDGLRS